MIGRAVTVPLLPYLDSKERVKELGIRLFESKKWKRIEEYYKFVKHVQKQGLNVETQDAGIDIAHISTGLDFRSPGLPKR